MILILRGITNHVTNIIPTETLITEYACPTVRPQTNASGSGSSKRSLGTYLHTDLIWFYYNSRAILHLYSSLHPMSPLRQLLRQPVVHISSWMLYHQAKCSIKSTLSILSVITLKKINPFYSSPNCRSIELNYFKTQASQWLLHQNNGGNINFKRERRELWKKKIKRSHKKLVHKQHQ